MKKMVIILTIIASGTVIWSNKNAGVLDTNSPIETLETEVVEFIETKETTEETDKSAVGEENKTTEDAKALPEQPISSNQKPTTTPDATYVLVETKSETKIVEPTPDFEKINTDTRNATINILCSTKGGELSPISGTGIVVTANGTVLTNAHVAQYLLLKDLYYKDFIECVGRTGSPAYPRYKLELVYIPPAWVSANTTILKDQNPQGTGEHDFALVRITGNIDGSALPNLPYVTANIRENLDRGETVLLASYPAGFLGGLSILRDLNLTSAITTIQDVFTFKENTIDIVAVGGTVVSQKGSSGGAVVDKSGTLIGIISTSSDADTTGERELNAITPAYINRSLQNSMSITLPELLSSDLSLFAKNFQNTVAPTLIQSIKQAIQVN